MNTLKQRMLNAWYENERKNVWLATGPKFTVTPISKPRHYFNKITSYIKDLFKPAKQPIPTHVVQGRSHKFSLAQARSKPLK